MAAEQPSPEKHIKQKKHCWHEQKHIRAFLSDKQKAIRYGIDDLLKRDKTGSKPVIVLMDGDRALEKAVKKVVEEKKITHRVDAYILDRAAAASSIW